MIIFIRQIPADTRPSELHDYVNPALKGGLFSAAGRVLKAEILFIRDKSTNMLESHGIVHVDSEAAGQRAIKRLRPARFKNKPVIVREYLQRDWHNDRRESEGHVPEDVMEKRLCNRRRGSRMEIIEDISRIFPVSAPADDQYSPA